MISPHKEMAGDRRKLLYFRTGMFNPIKHFLVPLCCCFCSLCGTISPGPWLWGTGGAQAGLEHPWHLLDKSRVLEMLVREQGGSGGWLGPPLWLFAGINNLFLSTVLCPTPHSRCWCWGTWASKGQSHCCHQQFIKLQTAPRESLQSHLKRNGLLKRASGTRWEWLGVYQWEIGISPVSEPDTSFPLDVRFVHSLGSREMALKSPRDCKCRGKLGALVWQGWRAGTQQEFPKFLPCSGNQLCPPGGLEQGLGEMWGWMQDEKDKKNQIKHFTYAPC